jgi:hypothetical protein
MQINEPDPNCFSYGIMFSFPRLQGLFMVKVTCYVSGKASIHIKSQGGTPDKRLREQTLDILSYLIFGWMICSTFCLKLILNINL